MVYGQMNETPGPRSITFIQVSNTSDLIANSENSGAAL
jgi:hypothetical protein